MRPQFGMIEFWGVRLSHDIKIRAARRRVNQG